MPHAKEQQGKFRWGSHGRPLKVVQGSYCESPSNVKRSAFGPTVMFFHETKGTQTVNRASEYVYTSILGNADDVGFRKVDTVALVDPSGGSVWWHGGVEWSDPRIFLVKRTCVWSMGALGLQLSH